MILESTLKENVTLNSLYLNWFYNELPVLIIIASMIINEEKEKHTIHATQCFWPVFINIRLIGFSCKYIFYLENTKNE